MPTTATTQATPMMMPSAVRSDRSLLRERARKATLRIFPVLVTVLSRPAGERLVEEFQRLVHLARIHDERRRDADDVAVEASFADQEAPLLRLLEEPDGLFGRGRSVLNGLVGHELESLHEAHAAHVAERLRVFRLQPVEARPQAPAHLGGAFWRAHLLHHLESGERGGRGDRVASERRDRERLEGVRDLRRRGGESAPGGVSIGTPSGIPFATPLAIVMISGSTFQCEMPNHEPPVRPKPVCTSSQMKTPPYFLTMPTAISKYSFGGVMNPPTP